MSKAQFLEIRIALKTSARYMLFVKFRKYQFLQKLRSKVRKLSKKFDILGPWNPPSVHRFRYVLMIVDEFSKFEVVKFLCAKSEALEKFQEFIAEHGISKVLSSDNGIEFTSKHFIWYCIENRTEQEYIVPETPEQNGMAERANTTVVEMTRCLLLQAKSPKTHWLRAIATVIYLGNRVSIKNESQSPFERFTGKEPTLEKLKKFGCTVFVQKPISHAVNLMKKH